MNKNKNKTLFKLLKDKHHNNQLITPCARYQGDFSGRYCLLPGRILRASVPDLACPPTKASSVYCSCQDWERQCGFLLITFYSLINPQWFSYSASQPDLPLGSTAQVEPTSTAFSSDSSPACGSSCILRLLLQGLPMATLRHSLHMSTPAILCKQDYTCLTLLLLLSFTTHNEPLYIQYSECSGSAHA